MKSSFPGAPSVVVAHYRKLLEGDRWEGKGVIRITKYHSEKDEATMRRLLGSPGMAKTWKKLQRFLSDTELVRFLNSAWIAALDYDQFRFSGETTRRKTELAEKVKEIQDTARHLSRLLTRSHQLGITPARYPDRALDSPDIQRELSELLERVEGFDVDNFHPEPFVNAALVSRERSPAREYLRAFVALLSEVEFSFDHRGVPAILAEVRSAVTGTPLSDRDARKVIAEISLLGPENRRE